MTKRVSIIICALLLAYFLFTSGLVFEAVGSKDISKIDTPYSLALSAERTGILEVYNEDDVACAKWIAERLDYEIASGKDTKVFTDYNGVTIMLGYTDQYYSLAQLEPEDGGYYLFLTSWNIRHGKMVDWVWAGLRKYSPLPDLSGAIEIFREGDSVVYYIAGN
jgi:uncharacterized membrane protein